VFRQSHRLAFVIQKSWRSAAAGHVNGASLVSAGVFSEHGKKKENQSGTLSGL